MKGYSENVKEFQKEYGLQLHNTVIITKTRHSLRFRLWSVSWN